MLLHFLLLPGIADQKGAGWKAGFTGGVLGVEVRGGEKELLIIGREFRGHACGRGSIFRAQARIHYQRCVATNNDSDVRKPHDRPDMVGDLRRVLAN